MTNNVHDILLLFMYKYPPSLSAQNVGFSRSMLSGPSQGSKQCAA